MIVSVIQDKTLQYPSFDEYLSPSECFPEYELGHVSREQNRVYEAVRACLAGASLDDKHYGQPSWNPLGAYIKPGDNVFVLCNFVQQEVRAFRTCTSVFAKCTHAAVIRPIIDYTLKALQGRGSVTFGNAPLQSCDWPIVVEETGADRVVEFYRQFQRSAVEVNLVDLRQHVMVKDMLGVRKIRHHLDDESDYLRVDLGSQSLLDRLRHGTTEPRFRVLDYDPRRTEQCHSPNRHVYFMSRQVLSSNVIISMPKLKTHEKVGVTCGLKGCVGAVAHKDCLAHHRYGPPSEGGDEYPESYAVLKSLSALHEVSNTCPPGMLRNVLSGLDCYSRKIVRRFTRSLSGGWPGNDTCWRMALDLARIVEYADINGILQLNPQRKHIMVTDGIVAGEGNGPLAPCPVSLGYVSFSDNLVIGDYVNCLAMGFDPERIPLIREAFRLDKYCLIDAISVDCPVQFNGRSVSVEGFRAKFSRQFSPPREWRAFLS